MKSRSLLKLKKLILILILGLISNQLLAQNNIGIFFQAVARDNYSNPAKSRKIYIQSSVIQSSATGTKVLIEEHQANTDATGMFNISIGNGNRVGGSATGFSSIDWSNGPFFLNLKVAITPMSGVTGWDYTKEWVDMGTTSFGAVPYALYAANAAGVNQKLNISDTSNMLSVYAKAIALQNLATTVNTKLSLSDSLTKYVTPTMLAANAFDSTSLSNRINLKANATDVNTSLATKVDKVTGKELSTNDYTNAEKTKLAAITGTNTGDQDLSALATNAALALKANTADVNTALALKANTADVTTALATKANTADVTTALATKVDKVTGKELSTNDYTTAEKSKLAAITGTNTGDQDLSALATNTALALKANTTDVTAALALKANTADVTTALATKVDKVNGKELSTNDYTTAEKSKLAAITGTNTGDQDLSALATNAALALKANTADVNNSLATKENTSNKSINITTDAASDTKYPSVKSVKTYVDAQVAGANIADADANTKGKIQLAGDLAGTAAAPTVPGLALKANTSSLSTVATSGSYNDLSNKPTIPSAYTLPTATASVLGGVKVGSNLSVDGNGVLTANINAGTLTGTTLAANVVNSSLTSVGTVTSGTISLTTDITTSGTLKAGAVTYPNIHGTNGQVLTTTGSGTLSWTSIPTPDLTNYVTTNTAQTITSAKTFSETTTFSKDLAVNEITVGKGKGNLDNTALGFEALNATGSDVTGTGNTAIGKVALKLNKTGTANVAVGQGSLFTNLEGGSNTAIGYDALRLNVGSENTAVGRSALLGSISGSTRNTAIGYFALKSSTGNTTGGFLTGSSNTAVGHSAGSGITTGSNNIAIGGGDGIAGGSNNTLIGVSARVSNGSFSNATAIGHNASVTASNTIQLGSTSVTDVKTSGNLTANGITVGKGGGNQNANTAIGASALSVNTDGNNNTAIGFGADVASPSLTNATAIGSGAIVAADNTIQLGADGTNNTTPISNVKTSGTLTLGAVTYPNTRGTSGQVLTTNGNGTATWAAGGVPYAGATGPVNLEGFDLKVNGITIGRGSGNSRFNTVSGDGALFNNTAAGEFNTASGYRALGSNTEGSQNTANGAEALGSNTIGGNNSAVGQEALKNNTEGGNNTAIGKSAGYANTTGNQNTAIGSGADFGADNLTNATAIGNGAIVAASNTIQLGNTDITNVKTSGTLTAGAVTYPNVHNSTSGQVLTINGTGTATWAAAAGGVPYTGATGAVNLGAYDLTVNAITVGKGGGNQVSNIAFGFTALTSNTTGGSNTAIGHRTLSNNLKGGDNTAIGTNALRFNTGDFSLLKGSYNTATGSSSLNSNTEGSYNTATGANALSLNTLGNRNTAIGYNALEKNTNSSNTAIGSDALRNNTAGDNNTATGADALKSNTTGVYNTAYGSSTLLSNSTGAGNTAIGYNALSSNTTDANFSSVKGDNNTAIGNRALQSNTIGSNNTASGTTALYNNTTGTHNTAIGTEAGVYIANGSTGNTISDYSVYLGSKTKASADDAQNEIVIGYNAIGAGSNTIQLGNTDITNVKTSGTLTAGTITYPRAHGTSGQVLSTTGSGTLSWTSIASPDLTNYVTTNTAQTITEAKTFSKDLTVNGITVGKGAGNITSNLVIGLYALSSNTSGSDNTAIGTFALEANASGYRNTAIGRDAGVSSGSLFNTTAIGFDAKATASNTIQLGNTSVTNVKTNGNLTVAGGITVGRGSGGVFSNSVIGFEALASNTESGISNTAIGNRALTANTTGSYNAAIGHDAGRYIFSISPTNNTTSDYSVYLGSDTKASADNAQNEIVIGYNAIGAGSNTIQLGNTNITNVKTSGTLTAGAVTYPKLDGTAGQVLSTNGSGTLGWTSIASPDLTNYVTTNTAQTITEAKTFSKDLTVNGITVGKGGSNVSWNTVFGNGALGKNTLGNFNTASGVSALFNNEEGSHNAASGASALFNNSTGSFNAAYGRLSLSSNTTGSYNTAIGYFADVATNNLTNATAIGNGAIVTASNTIQLGNTDVTDVKTSGTLTAGTVTYPNTHNNASGQVLTINNTGTATWAAAAGGVPYTGATGAVNLGAYDLTVNGITVGKGAGNGSTNTAIGYHTLLNNQPDDFTDQENPLGSYNTASGYDALLSNTTGNYNTASGAAALYSNQTGNGNTAIGTASLYSNTAGDGNIAIGHVALLANSTGSSNTAIGDGALINNSTGSNNTAIGYDAGVSRSNNNLSNTTAIGNGARVTASDMIQLGNSTVSVIRGAVAFSTGSDSRIKKSIVNSKYGLATVLKLRPVEYNLISNDLRQVGFIAQEVQKLVPEVVTGKEGDLSKGEILGITYSNLVPVLAKAIQEQQKQIEDQNAKIAAQQKQIEELIKLMKELKK